MLFKSDLRYLQDLMDVPDQKKIPQLYRADEAFAMEKGDGLFQSVIVQIANIYEGDGFTHTSIDTRTHMLMKGMFPCIPGWHCDDFYRPDDKSPDLARVEQDAPQKHYIVVLGTCSLTEFTGVSMHLPEPKDLPTENPAYFYYDEMIEKMFAGFVEPGTTFVQPNRIYSFGPTAFHRGSAATENGFRTFIRVTRSNHRFPKNEIRYQSNVYVNGRTSW